jgi:FkbM family methyltransferase
MSAFLQAVRSATTFLDIGANTGIYSLAACAVNPSVHVIAFEPAPRIRERLRENVSVNAWERRIEIRAEAVAGGVATASFHVPAGDLPCTSSLHPEGFRKLPGALIEVETTSVDAFMSGRDPADLLKIDVEGFENAVLDGMRDILERRPPSIILEVNLDGPHTAVQKILERYGYAFYHLTPSGARPMDGLRPDASQVCRNYLCVPPGSASL